MNARPSKETVESLAKWVTIAVTLAGFLWGVASVLQTRAIDARRLFLDRQLRLYEEATKTAAILATSDDQSQLRAAEIRFWQLYWGELAMVRMEVSSPRMEESKWLWCGLGMS